MPVLASGAVVSPWCSSAGSSVTPISAFIAAWLSMCSCPSGWQFPLLVRVQAPGLGLIQLQYDHI